MNTTNIATRLIAGALFTALISGTSALASAAADTDSLQKTVTYADINVSTASALPPFTTASGLRVKRSAHR